MRDHARISLVIAYILGLIWSATSFAQHANESGESMGSNGGYILKPGQGEDTAGDGSSIIKASPMTGTQGVVFVDDKMQPAGTSGIHEHLEADEFFYVLEGSGRMLLGDEEHMIQAGDFVFVPVATNHRVSSSADDPLHVLFIVDRPGLDEQFRLELQGLDRSEMTVEEFNKVVRQYGTVYKTFD